MKIITDRLIDQSLEKQRKAKQMAKVLLNGDYVFLDTETTGITNNDEVINLAFADKNRNILYDKLYKPSVPLNKDASKVTGITEESLVDKSTFIEEWNHLKETLCGKKLAIFNKNFDERLIRITAEHYHIPKKEIDDIFKDSICVMQLFSDYIDLPNVWVKMEDACRAENIGIKQNHLAKDDVLLMIELVNRIADDSRKPSVKRLYENIEDSIDNPEYKEKKKKEIVDSIRMSSIYKFKDLISERLPKSKDEYNKMFSLCYNYDLFPEGNEKKKLFNKTKRIFDNTKENFEIEKRAYRIYERRKSIGELYNYGYSVQRIAKAKSMSVLKVEEILRNDFSLNPQKYDLSQFVNPKYTDQIIEISRQTGIKLNQIKEKLPQEVTWMNIDVVLKYYEKGLLDELKEKSQYNYYDINEKKLISVKNRIIQNEDISCKSI